MGTLCHLPHLHPVDVEPRGNWALLQKRHLPRSIRNLGTLARDAPAQTRDAPALARDVPALTRDAPALARDESVIQSLLYIATLNQ